MSKIVRNIPYGLEASYADIKLDTIADLVNITGTPPEIVWVSGYHTKGDGSYGSHIFEWDPSSTEPHNGGTIIELGATFPTDWSDQTQLDAWYNYSGGITGRYKLKFDSAVNVRWFGAVGNGVTDDTLSAQKTIDSVKQVGILGGGVGSSSEQYILFPYGSYYITQTISVSHYMTLIGETSGLYTDQPIILIDTVGYSNRIQGFIFSGGTNHIAVIGPNLDTMQLIVDKCEFKNCSDCSILHDIDRNHGVGSSNPRTGFSMQQIISNFKSYASPLGRFACDGTIIDKGWSSFNPGRQSSSDVYWVEHNSPLNVTNFLGVSIDNSTGLQFWFKTGINDEAELRVLNSRFGEGGSSIVYANNAKYIEFHNCAIYGVPGNSSPYIEIYNRIPSIKITNCEGWTDSLGIMIDNATIPDIPTEVDNRVGSTFIDISSNKDGRKSNIFVHTDRETYNTNKTNQPNVNDMIIPLTEYVIGYKEDVINEFVQGTYDASQGSMVNLYTTNTVSASSIEFKGYSIGSVVSTANLGSWGRRTNNLSLSSGNYTFSMFLYADKPCVVSLYKDGSYYKTYTHCGNGWQKYGFLFFSSGTVQLGFQVDNIPVDGIVAAGLFSVTKGFGYVENYHLPGNTVNSESREVYYSNAVPSSGYHTQGTIIYNIAPVSSGSIGWVCVGSGDPGVWKTFGTIEA